MPIDIQSLFLAGIFLLAFFYTLYFARVIFLPLVLALLLSFMLTPLVRSLKRLKVPEALGAALLLLLLLGGVFYGFYSLSKPASEWIAKAPETLKDIEYKLSKWKKPVEQVTEATKQAEKLAKIDDDNETQKIEAKKTAYSDILLNRTWEFVVETALIIILLYFLLASGDLFLLKLVRVLPRLKDKKRAVEIARQTERDISIYLLTISIINAGLGITIGLAMFLLKMPNPMLWGVMAGLLNFIPLLGAIVGIATVGLVAFSSFENIGHIILVPAAYFVIHAFESNFITPIVLGHRLTLNPAIVFFSLTFWAWIWGIPGALIAVPMMAIFKIICDHIEPLAPIGEFLGK
ncbi:MAG TPA: AI-2E family transporter [Thermodesulfobacteriota bacterium]|nr:AI-2E family transporter [Thermodesulfobacteriota bacterium]